MIVATATLQSCTCDRYIDVKGSTYGRYLYWSVDEKKCRTGLNPVQQWFWNGSCYDSPFLTGKYHVRTSHSHWLLYSATMASPSTLCFSWAHTFGRVEPGSECEPVHSNIYTCRPLDYTATVQATNTVLKCELCTLAYILYKVEGQSFKMVATCIHTLHTSPCNEVIRIFRK